MREALSDGRQDTGVVTEISDRTGQNVVTAHIQLMTALVIGVLATVSACSSESTTADEHTSAPSPTDDASALAIAPEDIDDPSVAAVVAYERYWATVAEATSIPDPAFPALTEVAAGAALTTAQDLAQAALNAGERDTGAPIHDAEVTRTYPEADPPQYVITDCADSSEWITVDADTGEPIPDEEYGRRAIEALVEHVDGRWLVTEVAVQGLNSCLSVRAAPSESPRAPGQSPRS